LGGENVVQKLFTFASIVTLVTTLLVIFLFFNGTDIVEETCFFPTIMLGFSISIVLGWNIKNQKTKHNSLVNRYNSIDFIYSSNYLCFSLDKWKPLIPLSIFNNRMRYLKIWLPILRGSISSSTRGQFNRRN
jgi:uncharacterized membrane protein YjgN (DUF898 family)